MSRKTIGERIVSPAPLPPDVAALIGRIPLFETAATIRVAPLENVISLNNANYRLEAEGVAYVLRVASAAASRLGIRRMEEFAAAQAAADLGIAPSLLYTEPEGHCLSPLIDGRHWEQGDFHNEANLRRVAETLSKLHAVKSLSTLGSVYQRIERLLESAAALEKATAPRLTEVRAYMTDIEAMRADEARFTPGLTHNDFWANNFVDDGEQLWLLDWEFAGHGEGFYDLATACFAGNLEPAEQQRLLEWYGCSDPDALQMLDAMKFIASFFEAAWALVQHGLRGSSGFDYWAYSARMFERMEAHIRAV